MAYNNKEKKRTDMEKFFSGGYKDITQSTQIAEIGYGEGIGHIGGSYESYSVKGLREGVLGNSRAILVSEVLQTKEGELIISKESGNNKFSSGKIPVLFVSLINIVNPTSITVVWTDRNTGDTAIPSYYLVPSAYSAGYTWWDKYDVVFNIPELGDPPGGDYQAYIELRDERTGQTVMSNIDFSIE